MRRKSHLRYNDIELEHRFLHAWKGKELLTLLALTLSTDREWYRTTGHSACEKLIYHLAVLTFQFVAPPFELPDVKLKLFAAAEIRCVVLLQLCKWRRGVMLSLLTHNTGIVSLPCFWIAIINEHLYSILICRHFVKLVCRWTASSTTEWVTVLR